MVEDKTTSVTNHTYTKPGSYTAALVLMDDKGCSVVADGKFKTVVSDTSIIKLSYVPAECIFEGDRFQLDASAGDEKIVWQWSINNQTIGRESTFQFSIADAGEYNIMLYGLNSYNCPSLVLQKIRVHGNLKFIPNVLNQTVMDTITFLKSTI